MHWWWRRSRLDAGLPREGEPAALVQAVVAVAAFHVVHHVACHRTLARELGNGRGTYASRGVEKGEGGSESAGSIWGGVTYVMIPDFRWGTEPKSQRIRLHLDPVARQGVAPVPGIVNVLRPLVADRIIAAVDRRDAV